MSIYVYGNGFNKDDFWTEEQIDEYIKKNKEEDRQRYIEYCKNNPKPLINEFGENCENAEFLNNGGGVGLFAPETEEQWDQRMQEWKERIKHDSPEDYIKKFCSHLVTETWIAGETTPMNPRRQYGLEGVPHRDLAKSIYFQEENLQENFNLHEFKKECQNFFKKDD